MTPLVGLVLVLLSSLGWSVLDLLRKMLVARISSLALLFYLSAGMAPLYLIWVLVDGRTELPAGYWPAALASIALNTIANLAFFKSVRIAPLSLTIPLLSFTPVFATVLAIPLLGEVPTAVQSAGIALVVVGTLVLQLGAGEEDEDGEKRGVGEMARALLREKGMWLMLLTALCWSATNSFDKVAATLAGEPLHALILTGGVGLVCLALLAARRRLADLKAAGQRPGTVFAALVVGAAALGLQLVSYQVIQVGVVETLKRGIGNALAVLWGRIFFTEAVTAGKVLGVLLMAVGVGLVVMG